MPNPPTLQLYPRKTLDQITYVPKDIISVYVVEQHVWSNKGSEEERNEARRNRIAESQTAEEFLIDPARTFLMDIFRQLSAPYTQDRSTPAIGQGYWIQAEFGSGKSHLLSFIGALALGGEKEWSIVKEKEEAAGRGKRESLYQYFENGLAKKSRESKGILIAVKTLVGQGVSASTGQIGSEVTLEDIVLETVGDAFFIENGRSLPLFSTEILAKRFLDQDLDRYSKDLEKYLRDPAIFDEEEQQTLTDFLKDLQNTSDSRLQRDCGQKLWDFYRDYLRITPNIESNPEDRLKHMMSLLLEEGYAGLLLILDEVSIYMKGRTESQRAEDENTLVVLSNRLAKVFNQPIWTVCSAQQALEETQAGVKNIIADDRLKLIPLLEKKNSYYDIALYRVRKITDTDALDLYFEDYKRSFSWPQNTGKDEFNRFFPFYPPSIDVVKQVSLRLTTIRSALSFMLETLKAMRLKKSNELITHWSLFDDVVNYTEDPSGTNRSITAIKTKFTESWKAYEDACRQIDASTNQTIRMYRSRCEKVVKTLFLYRIANLAPDGLTSEEIMNSVMEWKDHDADRRADLRDNKDHYENLIDILASNVNQVKKVGQKYRFNEEGGIDPKDVFQQARAEAERNELKRRDAWHQLLALDGWLLPSNFRTVDLARGFKSLFREIAPEKITDITILWHNREIHGRVFMKDLLDIIHNNRLTPNINSADTGQDFFIFVSSNPVKDELDKLVKQQKDPRVLYWSPDELKPSEASLLVDFTAYRIMVTDYSNRDTADSKIIMDWVEEHLSKEMGPIYRIVTESYARGRVTAPDHRQMSFDCVGELTAIFAPLVTQVLDAVYDCSDMTFPPPAAFNDQNAVNVINGIVRMGEFPRGIKPSKEVSASQNFGFALGIMVHPNDKKLDLRESRQIDALADWVAEKTHGGTSAVSADTIYKNFTGINGPGGIHHGLSKRMVQLYLLCLVREGRIRITLSGHNQPVEFVDYTNIASIDFRAATLDAFEQVQSLKPPEGWNILAPFAAILLENESVKNIHEDAEIQQTILRMMEWKATSLAKFEALQSGLASTLEEFDLANPIADHLKVWEAFLRTSIDPTDSIAYWRSGLEKAFGYPVFHNEEIRPGDLDDLTLRRNEIKQIGQFHSHDQSFRTAMRYLQAVIPESSELDELRRTLTTCAAKQKNLGTWLTNETLLMNEFLTPMQEAMETYRVRYLQLFDQVVTQTEQVRKTISELSKLPELITLSALSDVVALGSNPCPELTQLFTESVESSSLFPANLTRAGVEKDLSLTPRPFNCPLTLENKPLWDKNAKTALKNCTQALKTALHDKARLLISPSLRVRLEKAKGDAFVDDLLGCKDDEAATAVLVKYLTQPGADKLVEKLKRILMKIRIKRIKLGDFKPGKHTLESDDLDKTVGEFRDFLRKTLKSDDKDESTIVEVE